MEQPSGSSPRGGFNPQQGPRSQPYKSVTYQPNVEEQQILKECRTESFYYRSLPFALGAMGTTQVLIQRKVLSIGRYGPFPKLIFAAFCGYSLGKISYINPCKNKILALPNSPMAEMIRNGTPQYMRNFYTGQAQEDSEQDFSSGNSGYKNDDHHVNLDLDTNSSRQSDDFDVTKRIAEEEEEKLKPPEMSKTYHDLRRENRSKDGGMYGRRDPAPQNQPPPPSPQPKDEFKLGRSKYLKKNQYGDVIDE